MAKFRKLELLEVTLICVAGINIVGAIKALLISVSRVKFGKVVFVCPKPNSVAWLKILGISVESPNHSYLNSMKEYNRYIVFELHKHISTPFCLLIQADGYILNPSRWTSDFLKYDYIGAPWPKNANAYVTPFGERIGVGNGGFSLRSRKLLQVPLKREIIFEVNDSNFFQHFGANSFSEDGVICIHNRHIYEEEGCKFAPVHVAAVFSREIYVPGVTQDLTFGFHKYRKTSRRLPND